MRKERTGKRERKRVQCAKGEDEERKKKTVE